MQTKAASLHKQASRRTFLGVAAASAVIVAGGGALAQQAAPAQQVPRVKGPRVWLDLDQEGLDAAARDFVAGMTDRYAVRLFEQLFIPKPWTIE